MRARGSRRRAMATLPEQLERLEASVTRAGGQVHWALDGAEANQIIADLVHSEGADRWWSRSSR